MKRLFIAVDISEKARNLAAKYTLELRSRFPDLRVGWERPEKLHLTIKFLGDAGDERIGQISERLAEAAGELNPFPLRMSGNGVFPSRNNARVLWLGIDDADKKLTSLAASIDETLAGIGFRHDKRRFNPHLTIARLREPHNSRALVDAHLRMAYEPVEFEIGELFLFESRLKPTGSVYFKLEAFPFAAAS